MRQKHSNDEKQEKIMEIYRKKHIGSTAFGRTAGENTALIVSDKCAIKAIRL